MAALRASTIDATLAALDQQLRAVPAAGGAVAAAVERFRADAAALLFHLRDRGDRPPIVVILGGTGTGKSTLINRLLDADVTAASFRRTFTAGAIAIAAARHNVPRDWLAVEHVAAPSLTAKGEADRLIVVAHESDLTRRATLVDTPDLDGDQPRHHAQAERAFRWAEAIVFLVTPEKYQMPELVPYYRLARRYAIPAMHVMNKVEQQPVVDDYRMRLGDGSGGVGGGGAIALPHVYAIPRDDANYEPPPDANLAAIRGVLASHPRPEAAARQEGVRYRTADLLDRFQDQILEPLSGDRRDIDRVVAMLKAMETPPAGIDVNPITRALARRLQQRSILYLIGPGRMLDRVRQVPALLARLPRTAWDLFYKGKTTGAGDGEEPAIPRDVPDFRALLAEQLGVLHSRIDDVIRATPGGERWIADDPSGYRDAIVPTERAAAIADDELAQLKSWLENRWNATPRDTAILQKVLKHLPGGEKLTQWSEAAPYLLTIVVATHHAFFGHVDLLILGGYTLATWLTERLSNEVASRTRQTNKAIADRFERLAHEQIARVIVWLDSRAPETAALEKMRKLAETLGGGE
jgi:hypothetical protein